MHRRGIRFCFKQIIRDGESFSPRFSIRREECLDDPAYGCQKTYVAEWRCGEGSSVQRAEVAGEAGYGSIVKLQCAVTP